MSRQTRVRGNPALQISKRKRSSGGAVIVFINHATDSLGVHIISKNLRELNKVYTNGTLVDEDLLTDEQAGHCVSIREFDEDESGVDSVNFGICVLDSATSEFNLSAFEDDVCKTRLETLLRQLRPKEILFTKVGLFLLQLAFALISFTIGLVEFRVTCRYPRRGCSRLSFL